MSAAVVVRDLSKVYRRRGQRAWIGQELLRWASRKMGPRPATWALRDVSFEVGHGRSLGIIGQNGAGKSTLLKILAGITPPTAGRAVVSGRISTQLGLGLGFNSYLTGRENLILEGSILGLTNAELRRRLGNMIDYAAIDGAIDEPLWTYSSGMVARLGFAVAAHTDFDVLLLDEALGAGDAAFRRRCDESLDHFRSDGRTLVIVSHGLDAVRRLCDDVLWLHEGRVKAIGSPDEILESYDSVATRSLSVPSA